MNISPIDKALTEANRKRIPEVAIDIFNIGIEVGKMTSPKYKTAIKGLKDISKFSNAAGWMAKEYLDRIKKLED